MRYFLPVRNKLNRKFLVYLGVVVTIGLLFFAAKNLLPSSTSSSVIGSSSQLKPAISTTNINHELLIPIKNSKGEEVTQIRYLIQNAELRKEILVKGRRATTLPDRSFLILNLKLTNDYNKGIEVNTKDFIRLSIGDNSELFAPSIHNDPVTLQAIAAQPGRVGFAINESDKKLKLVIGEIKGEKITIDLNF